ncbi:hypothetical protein DMUE_3119 [Dictyocoela muelleri]|nr:hypothetical protein DMUE_3119 [Dictyocoela muelleri]
MQKIVRFISPNKYCISELKRIYFKKKRLQAIFRPKMEYRLSIFYSSITIRETWLNFMSNIVENHDLCRLLLHDLVELNPGNKVLLDFFANENFILELEEIEKI